MGYPMTVKRVLDRNRLTPDTILANDIRRLAEDTRRLSLDEAIAAVGRLPWNPVELPDGVDQEWAVGEYASAVIDALTRLRDGAS